MAIAKITANQRYRKANLPGTAGVPVVAADVNPIIDAVNDILDGTTTLTEVEVSAGTAAEPSISFVGDTDTGIYRSAANETAVTAGGTGQVIVADGSIKPVTDNDIDLGTTLLEFKDLFIDGTANIDALVADTADINAGTIDGTVIGGTATAAGSFTTLGATGLITGSGSATITTGAVALNLASDASTGAVNIGTGAGARTIIVGNLTTTSGVTLNAGTGSINMNSLGEIFLDSTGVLDINSSAQAIRIGNDAVAQAIDIGTGAAARTITVGNATGTTAVVINAGSGDIATNKVIRSVGATASGTAATNGFLYTGTLVNTVGATPQTLNTLVGTALFNAIADTAAGADVAATQVINNSLVTANTRAIVSVFSQTVAANSCFVVKNVTMGAGTITVTLNNAGSATSGAAGVCGISFALYQL